MGQIKILTPVISDPNAGAANLAKLQAFSDAGGGTVDCGGEFYLNGTFLAGDYPNLSFAPGVRARQAPGTNKPLFATKKWAEAWQTATITFTAGASTAVVNQAGHDYVLGDSLVLQGAVDGAAAAIPLWDDIYQVVQVNDANSVTISLPNIQTVAPVGNVSVKRCNRGAGGLIDINLYWDFANNSGAAGQNRMAAITAFLANAEVRVKAKDVHKYGLLLAGVANITGSIDLYDFGNSDGLKVYGASENVLMKVSGITPEDCFSVQSLEPAEFLSYMPCKGEIRNVVFEKPTAVLTTAGSGPAVLYSDDRYAQKGIALRGGVLRSKAAGKPPFLMRPGTDFTGAQSKFRDATLDGVRLEPGDSDAYRIITKATSLTIRKNDIRKPTVDNRYIVYVTNAGALGTLSIEDVCFDETTWPAAATSYFLNNEGSIGEVVFGKCYFSASAFMGLFRHGGFATLGRVVLDNCKIDKMALLGRIEQSASNPPIVEIMGGQIANTPIGVSGYRSCSIIAKGTDISGMTGGLARANGAAGVLSLDAKGCNWNAGSVPFAVGTAGGTVDVKSLGTPIDIGLTGVNRSAGNMALTTAARGTIPANTPVEADGSVWRSMLNPWQMYPYTAPTVASASTVTLPDGDVIQVTGTTGITNILATNQAGRRATLVFVAGLTVTDGGNLKLNGNLVATADTTLTLACDGTNWYEIGRSVN